MKGDTIFDLLPSSLADRLARARQKLRFAAAIDESLLLPAWQRYDGGFYRAAGASVGSAIAEGVTVLVISGGYGVVVAQEPIGMYERRLSLADWPPGLLAVCLERSWPLSTPVDCSPSALARQPTLNWSEGCRGKRRVSTPVWFRLSFSVVAVPRSWYPAPGRGVAGYFGEPTDIDVAERRRASSQGRAAQVSATDGAAIDILIAWLSDQKKAEPAAGFPRDPQAVAGPGLLRVVGGR